MSFISAGNKAVVIIAAGITAPKYNKEQDPDKFDICLTVREEETGYEDYWLGEISSKMITGGKFTGKPQFEATLDSLRKIGWAHEFEFAKLPELVNVKTVVGVTEREYNGSKYYDVKYIGNSGSEAPVTVAVNDMAARMARIQAGAQPVSFGAPQAQAPVMPAPQVAQAPIAAPQVTPTIPAGVPIVPQVMAAVPVAPVQQMAPQVPAMPMAPAMPQAPVAQTAPPMPMAPQ